MLSARQYYRRIRRKIGPRRVQLFTVGPGKSGSNSLANLFRVNYRSGHEAEARHALELLIRYRSSEASDEEVRDYLVARDRRQQLEGRALFKD